MSLTQLSDSTFHQLLDAAPDSIIISNNLGEIVMANNMAMSVFGYEQKELIGKPVEILVPEQFRSAHPGHRENYYQDQPTRPMGTDLELTGLRKDGSQFPVEIALSPLKVGNTLLITAVIRDITRRHNLIQQIREKANALEASNAELEQFAYVASHDLQEPLRMVASYAQLLFRRNENKLDDDSKEFIDFLVDGAKRMQNLIDDLLSYSRVGKHEKAFDTVNTEEVLKRVLMTLGMQIEEHHVKVSYDKLPAVSADDVQLGQLFQNLIVNAIKFRSKRQPSVHIAAEVKENEVVFSVRDNGIGIQPEYQKRIFDIFQRLHSREEYPGTGIGLAICKKIVERHGGSIWVESEPEKGTVFYFSIKSQMKADYAENTHG